MTMPAPSPFQTAVFGVLGQDAALSAAVGARIYPDLAPQGCTRPFCVFQEISADPATDLDSSSNDSGAGGLILYRLQVTSYAEGAKGASTARGTDKLVRDAMRAASASGTLKSRWVDSRALDPEVDVKLYGHQSDFLVWFKSS